MSFSVIVFVWLLTAVLVYNFFNPVSAWPGNLKGIDHISERSSGQKNFNKSSKVVENTSKTKQDGYHINEHLQKKNEQKTIDTLHNGLNISLNRSLLKTFSRKKRGIIFKNEDIEIRSATMTILDVQEYASVQLNITCLNVWCEQPSQIVTKTLERVHGLSNKSVLFIDDLQPFTDYNITFKFCRENENCSENVITKQIRTKPAAPSSIYQLQAYSKDDTSISLRWKPPYPPTGELARYRISYILSQEQTTEKTKGFQVQPCYLWPEHHCYTLSGLKSENEYSITLAAKNEDPEEYGQSSETISVITKKEPSDAPYDLNVEWTIENNLILKWKHPGITNGDIQYFDIILYPVGHEFKTIKVVFKISKPNLQYTYNIDAKELLPSTNYHLSISAYNDFSGKNLTANFISPPNIPSFHSEPQLKVSDKIITLSTSVGDLHSEKLVDSLPDYELFIFISDGQKKGQFVSEAPDILKPFQLALSDFYFLYDCKLKGLTKLNFNIGKNDDISSCEKITNYLINLDDKTYNVTMILTNTVEGRTSYKLYTWLVSNQAEISITKISLITVSILLITIIVGLFLYFIFKKRLCLKKDVDFIKNPSEENSDLGSSLMLLPYTGSKTNLQKYSKRIKLSELEEYVKQSVQNGELERQYKLFPSDQTMPWNYGALEANRSKNRYVNLIAYDHSRVVLQKVKDKEYSDYINANYIDGYKIPKAYIATQAPKLLTGYDFWRMVWQNNVRYIVMLANVYVNDKKIHQYWPEMINDSTEFDDIIIRHVSSQIFADYVHRIFHVSYAHQTRTVQQFHFTAWPAHNVPIYPQILIPFLEQIHQLPLSSDSPMVVHCDAGVGRTGTVLLCDICLRMIEKEKAVDVLRNLYKLRSQRVNMVNSLEQYKLVHLVILGYMFKEKTSIPCNAVAKEVKKIIKNEIFKLQMEYLEDVAWKDDVMKSLARNNDNVNVVEDKNRFPDVIPEACSYVCLSPYPSDDDNSTYINAITVERFRTTNRFIVTQQPLPNTVGDFWRLVHEQDISLIVSLNTVNLNDLNTCIFWPNNCIKPVDYLMVSHENTLSSEHFDKVTVLLTSTNEKEERIIEIMVIKCWPPKTECPNSINNFLDIVEQAQTLSRPSKRVVVTCYDGVTASGLYVAMDFIVEKIKFERVCDVCEAVRSIRRSRKQFVRSEEQFVFLYKAAAQYVQSYQRYSNFL